MQDNGITDQVAQHGKTAVDTVAVAVTLASLVQWLPSIAAAVSIIWGLIRIYETQTVQHMLLWIGRKL